MPTVSRGQVDEEGRAMTILDVALHAAGWLVVLLAADAVIIGLYELVTWTGR